MAIEQINAALRTLVDGNMDVFRYGLFKYDESNFEDPTYLGFTIEIDENSALFTQVEPFLQKYGSTRSDINSRIPVYKEFKNKIVQIFKSQESVVDKGQESIYIKQHYINSIKGLDLLTKKFTKWQEDKLEIELYEDMTLYSTYITQLYNNLIYSYETGRALIPENLLKFNLKIKISEIRNLTSIAKLNSTNTIDQRIVDGLKNNITCVVYTLYDCEFDFINSVPFTDTITQAGIGATTVGESILNFNIFFKSVARTIFNPLINNALSINDNVVDLGVILINSTGNSNTTGQVINNSGTTTGANGDIYQELSVDGKTTRQYSFPNDARKPSSISTYTAETTNNPELKGNSDLNEMDNQRKEIQSYNAPLAPDPTDIPDYADDKLTGNSDNSVLSRIIGKDLNNVIQDPAAAVNALGDKVKSKVENTVKDRLRKAEQALKQKRNALVRNFINDVTNKAGLKKIVPANVNTNPNYYRDALAQLKGDIGLTITDDITKILTGN